MLTRLLGDVVSRATEGTLRGEVKGSEASFTQLLIRSCVVQFFCLAVFLLLPPLPRVLTNTHIDKLCQMQVAACIDVTTSAS